MNLPKWVYLVQLLLVLVVGTLMSIITEYYTAMGKRPVMIYHPSISNRSCNQCNRWTGSGYGIYFLTYTGTGRWYLGFI